MKATPTQPPGEPLREALIGALNRTMQPEGWDGTWEQAIAIAQNTVEAALSATAPQQGEAGEEDVVERVADAIHLEARRLARAVEGSDDCPVAYDQSALNWVRNRRRELAAAALAQSPVPDAVTRLREALAPFAFAAFEADDCPNEEAFTLVLRCDDEDGKSDGSEQKSSLITARQLRLARDVYAGCQPPDANVQPHVDALERERIKAVLSDYRDAHPDTIARQIMSVRHRYVSAPDATMLEKVFTDDMKMLPAMAGRTMTLTVKVGYPGSRVSDLLFGEHIVQASNEAILAALSHPQPIADPAADGEGREHG